MAPKESQIPTRSDYFRDQWRAWRILGALQLNARNYWSGATVLNIVVALYSPALLLSMFSFDTPLENITNFSLSITSTATILKFGLYVVHLGRLREMEKIITRLDNRVAGAAQQQCHRLMAKKLRKLSNVFLYTYGFVFLNSEFSFLFTRERSLPFPSWFPFDWKNSTTNYIGALCFQLVSIFGQILQNFADDSFPPVALCLCAEHCQLLILRISSIGHESNEQDANDAELVLCIKDQKDLYGLLQLTSALISWPMTIQFFVMALNIGATTFGLVFFAESMQDRMYFASYLLALVLQTYPICFYGSLLEERFGELHYAVFCSNWVNQNRRYRTNMLILAERTKSYPRLLAGNLVPIHLSTFQASCKAAYSFFTLIGNTRDRAKSN
ncbi:odorant receptor 23a [Drosophila subobscura]|uniref:odorant receptor 23a n=1 Tax=Drosophila subobscura TaxID=7241 RepID=UPI00155ABA16|nr:odorant receptor 23a [Drosophila subobscura]